jgi:hypothetical protein
MLTVVTVGDVGGSSLASLAQITPADLDIPILGQLALPEFSFGDPLEAGPL